MDILEAFFPFRDFFGPLKLAVTPFFISAIILGFLWFTTHLLTRLQSLRRKVELHAEKLDEALLGRDSVLQKSWEQYSETFFTSEENQTKTVIDATEYFGPRVLLGEQINLRFWAALPGLFLGIGILGTFLGLTLGIEGFDTSDPDTIQESINTLLSGMATAFLTSLYGMTASLLFNFLEKHQIKTTSIQIERLCQKLNKRYHLSQSEAIRSEDNRRWRVLKQLFVDNIGGNDILPSYALRELLCNANQQTASLASFPTELKSVLVDQADGNEIFPSHVLRDLLRNSNEQTKSLKSFSTDLADGIAISSQTLERMGNQIGSSIGTNLEKAIMPAVENLTEVVNELRSEKQQSSGEFISKIVDDLGETVADALAGVNESFSASTIKQMEDLATTVSTAGESFSKVPALIEETMKSVNEGMTATTQSFLVASETAISHLDSVVERYTATAEKTEEIMLAFNEALSSLDDTSDGLKSGVDSLTEHMRALEKSSSSLEVVSSNFEERCREFASDQKDATRSLSETLGQTEELVRTNAEHISDIEAGLSSVFGQLQDGLSQYQDTTKSSINSYLSTMAKETSNTIRCLAGSLEELREVLDSLESHVDNGRDN